MKTPSESTEDKLKSQYDFRDGVRGKAPTGIQVRLHSKSEAYIHRGKIVKQWREMDEQGLEEQLESG